MLFWAGLAGESRKDKRWNAGLDFFHSACGVQLNVKMCSQAPHIGSYHFSAEALCLM